MPDVSALAEEAVARLQAIMNRWPRPLAGQGVRADAVRAGLAPLVPVAEMALRLPLGYGKGYLPGLGFLTSSSKVTVADQEIARAILNDAKSLVYVGEQPLTREYYGKIKERAYKLLALATDLDVTSVMLRKIGAAATAAWDPWVSLAVVRTGA